MKVIRYMVAVVAFLIGISVCGLSQEKARFDGVCEFDSLIHDFGDILTSDGPVSCRYTVTNIGKDPMVIYNVASSCGCTGVEWTRQPVKAGEKGYIDATFSNEDGAYPFDKTLTVYISGVKKPVILHLRGSVHKKKLPLSQLYGTKFGPLGLKEVDIKAGNMSQGQQKSGEVTVANIGEVPLQVTFKDVSEGLKVAVTPNPVPAGGTAKLLYTVSSSRSRWGKNYYYATPVVNGRTYKSTITESADSGRLPRGTEAVYAEPNPLLEEGSEKIGFYAYTKEDFNSWPEERRVKGAQPVFDESTFSFGKVKAGTLVEGTYTVRNEGKSTFEVYKFDAETRKITSSPIPRVEPGKSGSFKVTLDTSGLPKGETLFIVSLTTNSPLRPLVNLYVAGWIE